MKKLVIVMLLVGVTPATGQTFVGLDKDYEVGISAGFGGRAASFDGEVAALGSIHGAITVDHQTVIGIEAVAVVSEPMLGDATNGDPFVLQIVYGGLFFERVFLHRRAVHPLVRATIGGGGIAHETRDAIVSSRQLMDGPDGFEIEFDPSSSMDAFVVVEPGLGLEFVLTPTFRIEVAALYRIVAGVSTEGLSSSMLMGPSLALTLKTGLF